VAGTGVTTIVPGTRPARGSTVAPRTDASVQSPGGPSTRSVNGLASARPSGHNFGDFQSYGPHSSTMMASRPRRSASGIFASIPPGSGRGSAASIVGRERSGTVISSPIPRLRVSPDSTASVPTFWKPLVSTLTFCVSAILSAVALPLNVLPAIT
jgi:hypothetical protein